MSKMLARGQIVVAWLKNGIVKERHAHPELHHRHAIGWRWERFGRVWGESFRFKASGFAGGPPGRPQNLNP